MTYDSRSVLGSLGPQVRIGTGTVTLEGVASRMWYGGAGYNTAYGGRVSGRFLLSNEWRMTGVATWTAQDYDTATYLNGKKVTARAFTEKTESRGFPAGTNRIQGLCWSGGQHGWRNRIRDRKSVV